MAQLAYKWKVMNTQTPMRLGCAENLRGLLKGASYIFDSAPTSWLWNEKAPKN